MALTQWQLKPVDTDSIASGDFLIFSDENETGDPINKLTVDNLMETGIPLVTEDTIAVATDYILFLDGSSTGNTNKEQFTDVMTAIAGTNISASSGVLNVDDAFLINNGSDTTTGTITAAGLTLAADGVITLVDEGKVKFTDDVPSTDHTATGVTIAITSSSTLARGVPVYINGSGTVTAADADAAASMPAIGINTTDLSGGAGEAEILLLGIWRDDTYNFTVGADIFVGLDPASSTANSDVLGITTVAPTGSGDTVQKVGVVLTVDTIFVNFNTTEVLLA